MIDLRPIAREAVKERGAQQMPSELVALGELVLARIGQPRRVLEIGSAKGGVLWFLSHVAADDAVLVSLDVMQQLNAAEPRARQQIYKVELDSAHPAHAQWVDVALSTFDLVFIDGDHTALAVERDYRRFGRLVRPGGLIAFHDIAWVLQVARTWERIRDEGATWTEIVHTDPNFGQQLGIGVIQTHES